MCVETLHIFVIDKRKLMCVIMFSFVFQLTYVNEACLLSGCGSQGGNLGLKVGVGVETVNCGCTQQVTPVSYTHLDVYKRQA